jgi:hypothetical protein
MVVSTLVAITLAASTSLTGSTAFGDERPEAAVAPVVAAPAAMPEIGVLEDALPPGVRNFLSGVRIIKGLGARNRVYREARYVQRDLRAYYDAQIETARQQLLNREQLGFSDSRVRAYWRVLDQLKDEKSAAMSITEDEKRAAKYGFESALKQEMMSSLIRVPRMRRGLQRAKEAIEDLRDGFEKARIALEGGNPVSAVIGELRAKLDKLDRYAQVGGLINGNVGATLGGVSKWAGDALDRLEAPIDEAAGAANEVIGQLDGLTTGIDDGLESTRTVRADAALEQAADELFERVFAPGGRGATPEVDVVADAIARDSLTPVQRSVGVAIGAIDPSDFRRMRERVHAALLGRSLERIGEICGRLPGAAQRIQLEAAANGEPAPDTSTPCTLFGNPEALQAFIDSQNTEPDADQTTTTVAAGDGSDGVIDPAERDVDGEYTGAMDGEAFEFDGTESVIENEVRLTVVDGTVGVMEGSLVVTAPCEGGSATLGIEIDSAFDAPVGAELGWVVSGVGTMTLHASGSCEEEDAFVTAEDFDGLTAPFDAVLDLSTDVGSYTLTFEEGDVMTGTVERVAPAE